MFVPTSEGFPRCVKLPALALLAACVIPTAIAIGAGPLQSFYSQATACFLWGAFLFLESRWSVGRGINWSCCDPVLAVPALLTIVMVVAGQVTGLPRGIESMTIAFFVSVVIVLGASAGGRYSGRVFLRVILLCALLNCIPAILQAWSGSDLNSPWLAKAWGPGRATGNIRQPNLLATLVVMGLVAGAALLEIGDIGRPMAWAATLALALTAALAGSRTGFAELAMVATIATWHSALQSKTRQVLISSPAFAALFWTAFQIWSHVSGSVHARAPELASGRFALWKQCLQLIGSHPWLGVGLGNFNFAWTLTPFDRSNPETFDHAHNLLLQWAVELGIPLTLVLVAIGVLSVRHAVRRIRETTGDERTIRRFCGLMVVVVMLHSLTEYPLWHAHFLLPTVYAWAIVGGPTAAVQVSEKAHAARTNWLGVGGLLMALAATFAIYDYQKIVPIWRPVDNTPIEQRVAEGRKSMLFSPFADRFAGTLAVNGTRTLEPYKTATRQLLDMRLLIAWSLAMRESGQLDKARYLAQRVHDFNDPVAKQFFEKCTRGPPESGQWPWQCTPPTGHYTYEDFL